MLLWIAIGIAFIIAFFQPYSDGLVNTSAWFAKITTPDYGYGDSENKRIIKLIQAGLMHGFPSNVPFTITLLCVGSIVMGFFYRWWGGFVVYGVYGFTMGTVVYFYKEPVSKYLIYFLGRMSNRVADYKKNNDFERAEAAELMVKDLSEVLALYLDSGVKVPTEKQIKDNPLGDMRFLLE